MLKAALIIAASLLLSVSFGAGAADLCNHIDGKLETAVCYNEAADSIIKDMRTEIEKALVADKPTRYPDQLDFRAEWRAALAQAQGAWESYVAEHCIGVVQTAFWEGSGGDVQAASCRFEAAKRRQAELEDWLALSP